MIASTFKVVCDKNGEGEDMLVDLKEDEHIMSYWDGTIRIKEGPAQVRIPFLPITKPHKDTLNWMESELAYHAEMCYTISDGKWLSTLNGSEGAAAFVFKGVLIPQDQR